MQYEAPTTVSAALDLLSNATGECRVMAGGTDLLVRLRAEMSEPDLIVDIKRIEGMRDIVAEDGGWRIGAAVSGAEMSEHDTLGKDWPGVVEGMDLIGSTQVQGRATLAGNLCNASPAADSVPAMAAANAIARVAGQNGTRDVPVADIPAGPGKTTLTKDEFITSIFLPARGERASDAYLRFIPRTEMDIAVVGCGVSLTLDADGTITDANVSLGAVAPTVIVVDAAAKALTGTKLDEAALEALAAACSEAATPISDKRGTVEFRKHVSGVLAQRAAKIAYQRAGGAS
ncbi:Nicotinate dehydrogenase FAD-subunit [Roseovarius albus]|uniref:Nicotinate dehydrogenase FAD-subunit n=1 Tax=Roseovarius albus TaxID=1247867 RepID=A0A1X6Z967_9RHOB|nr:xanthine dehydrogenase family protein subunit M [Roseovarius albus]SLN44196.1 Nicotinate dehydrogenase FAD-subunit [Roseovarius albus]